MGRSCRRCVLLLMAICCGISLQPGVAQTASRSTWSGHGKEWQLDCEYEDVTGYAARPVQAVVNTIRVEWLPLSRDRLGNFCIIGGQMRCTEQGRDRPVDWFQGITVYLSKRPDYSPDWSVKIDQSEVQSATVKVTPLGTFEAVIDLDGTRSLRHTAEDFQVAVALATHPESDPHHVRWISRTPAVPSSVRKLTLPGADKLPDELELLNDARNWPDPKSSGVSLIRAVNGLRLLGKERALKTLELYLELQQGRDHYRQPDFLFWVIRLLFEPIALGEQIPVPHVPFMINYETAVSASWPLISIEVVDDIPFRMNGAGFWSGPIEHPVSHIKWARDHGVIRDRPLKPATHPLAAAEKLISSPKFNHLFVRDYVLFSRDGLSNNIREQALAMVPDFIQPIPKNCSDQSEVDANWQSRLTEANLLQVRWDDDAQRYVIQRR